MPAASTRPRRRSRAPAKLNLGLRVVGRRADGYHLLESLFVPLDLADEVELEIEPEAPGGVSLELVGAPQDVPAGADNLAARAAEGFLAAAGLRAAIRIRLSKRIPAEAGLGGGSSDAGAVLRLLAAHWPESLAPETLAALAAGLGADVPFFLDPRPAWVEGVGERCTPLTGLPSLPLLLVRPGRGLSTAAVFAAYAASGAALTPPGGAPRIGALLALGSGEATPGPSPLANDLEAAATSLCPEIEGIQARLRAAGARACGMSGSGPTVFGIFGDLGEAERAGESLGAGVWWTAAVTEASH